MCWCCVWGSLFYTCLCSFYSSIILWTAWAFLQAQLNMPQYTAQNTLSHNASVQALYILIPLSCQSYRQLFTRRLQYITSHSRYSVSTDADVCRQSMVNVRLFGCKMVWWFTMRWWKTENLRCGRRIPHFTHKSTRVHNARLSVQCGFLFTHLTDAFTQRIFAKYTLWDTLELVLRKSCKLKLV